jgi:nitrate reductase NapAB chaperone NapD
LRTGSGEQFSNPLSEEQMFILKDNFSGIWKRITDLTSKGYDTEFIQDLAPVACYTQLFIHKDRKGNITLRPLEPIEEGLSFINKFVDEYTETGRLSILVDSHLPDFKLEGYFKSKLEYFPWGDPNDTNSHIAYFCDSKTFYFETMQYSKAQKYLQNAITEICTFHAKGNDENLKGILIVCMNTTFANEVRKWRAQGLIPNIPDENITWYRSTMTRGVRFDGTVQIMVGGPYIPVVAYHHKFMVKPDKTNSASAWDYAFRKSNMVSEEVNASTRVKDPEGKRDSFIYCLGITETNTKSLLDWNGHIYTSGVAKRPYVFGCLTTGAGVQNMLEATELFQNRHLINDAQKHIPYLTKLLRANEYYKTQGQLETIALSQIFRDKTAEAYDAIEKNITLIENLGIHIKTRNNGGLSMVFQDNKKLLIETIAGSCRLENVIEISSQ